MAESTTVTIADPDLVAKKTVDSSGRLYLGQDYAGDRVIVERVEGNDE